jgi:hypothetical protein
MVRVLARGRRRALEGGWEGWGRGLLQGDYQEMANMLAILQSENQIMSQEL